MKETKHLIILLLVISFIISISLFLHNYDYQNRIDINNATQNELMKLPGIGEILARKIIENRPYKDIEELINIDGIGEKKMESLRRRIKL